MAQVFRSDGWVKTTLGPAVTGASIYVCTQPVSDITDIPPSPLAQLYSDPLGQNTLPQPVTTDGFGHYDFYIATGTYTVVVVYNGKIQQVYPDQSIGGTGSGTFTLNGLTGNVSIQAGTNISIAVVGSSILISGQAGGVSSLNTLTGALSITAGAGIAINPSGENIQISNTLSGGGVLGKWSGNWIGANAAGFTGSGGSASGGGNVGMNFVQVTGQPQTVQNPTATVPRGIQVQSPALNTASGYIDIEQNLTPGLVQDWFMNAQIVGTVSSRYFIGFTDTAQGNVATVFFSDTPNANFIGFRWSAGTDVNIKAVCCTSSANITVVDTGVSTVTGRHTYEIVPTSNGGTINFYIDGSLVATISTTVPTNTTAMASIFTVDGKNSGTTTFNINFYYVYTLLNS